MQGFRVALKTFLGLAMCNQCCHTVITHTYTHTHTTTHFTMQIRMYVFLKHCSHILLALVIGLVINGPEKPSNILIDLHLIMSDAITLCYNKKLASNCTIRSFILHLNGNE